MFPCAVNKNKHKCFSWEGTFVNGLKIIFIIQDLKRVSNYPILFLLNIFIVLKERVGQTKTQLRENQSLSFISCNVKL